MSNYLKPSLDVGTIIRTNQGETFQILSFIGSGGQGEVYRVRGANREYALKWYYADRFLKRIDASAFYKNLERNVNAGVPSLTSGNTATQFIWPLKVVPKQYNSYGYIMNLFEPGYESMKNILLGRHKDEKTGENIPIRWKSWEAVINASLNIVQAFEILHSRGLSYQDLNEGGISINPNNGDAMICDCDNVSPDKTNMGIRGVMNYMAPEVICGVSLPNVRTDAYSLAIILFRLFFYNHPMEGVKSIAMRSDESRSRQEIDLDIYGRHPHYCLDVNSNVNPPAEKHKDVRRLCAEFPRVLFEAFQQVFTEGVQNPGKRLTATEWRKVLLQVRDSLVMVQGREQFYFTPYAKKLPENARVLVYPNGHKVLCMPDKLLYAYHFDQYNKDFHTPMARVLDAGRNDALILFNGSGKTIFAQRNGVVKTCKDRGAIPLMKGVQFRIGQMTVEVE